LSESWEKVQLGSVLTQAQYGLSVRGEAVGTVPILRMNCQDRGQVLLRDLQYVDIDEKTFAAHRLESGDILFNRTNSFELVGRTAVFESDVPAVFASYLVRLKVDRSRVDPAFLTFYLNWPPTQLRLKTFATRGVSQANISASKLKELEISLPPLDRQKTISTALSVIRSVLQSQEQEVRLLRELKSATIAKLFREGLRREPLKQTEIGEIPQSWQVVTLGGALSFREGLVDPRVEPYRSMTHLGPDSIESSTGRLLQTKTAGELSLISGKYLFRPGDVVYSKIRPYLCKVWLASFEGICSADMYPLRARVGFDPSFLAAYFLSDLFTAQAVAHQARTGIPKINREQLASCFVPQPSLDEQRQIGITASSLAIAHSSAVRRRDLLNEFFEATLSGLLARRD
jgi:type I restriction enzyme, S subunit